MKGKNLQLRLLYLTMISFKIDGEIKSFFRQAKVKRIQYHQTSFTTNTKGTSLGKKHKRREQKRMGKKKTTYKNKPQTIKTMALGMYQ